MVVVSRAVDDSVLVLAGDTLGEIEWSPFGECDGDGDGEGEEEWGEAKEESGE